MRELIVVLVIIIAVIAMIWYLRSPRAQTAVKSKERRGSWHTGERRRL